MTQLLHLQSFIGQALRPTNYLLRHCLVHYCVVMRVVVPNQVILMLPIIAKLGPNIIEVVLMKTGQIYNKIRFNLFTYISSKGRGGALLYRLYTSLESLTRL